MSISSTYKHIQSFLLAQGTHNQTKRTTSTSILTTSMTRASQSRSTHTMMRFFTRATLASLLVSQALGHTWVEQMQVIEDGKYVGDPGYARGYVARTDPGFNGDSDNYLLPPLASGRTRVDGSDLLCHPSQRTQKASTKWPQLRVAPGNFVAMKYLENGHVTLPDTQKGKPEAGGTVFVFGTTQPQDDEKITDVLKWTSDGSGGDKRGKLLTAQNYDDGRCHQLNGGSISQQRQQQFPDRIQGQPGSSLEQWCETDLKVPEDVQAGAYTVYWIWQWPTAPGQDPILPNGKDEYYTTCSDFEVVGDTAGKALVQAQAVHTLPQSDPQTAAVADYQSRKALTTAPLAGELASASGGGPSPQAPTATRPSKGASVTQAPLVSQFQPFSVTTIVVTEYLTSTVEAGSGPTRGAQHSHSRRLSMRGHGSAKFRLHR